MRSLMAEQGFRVSMEAVAQRAGCSKQTLYSQFGSKHALLQDLMHDQLQLTTARLGSFAGGVRAPLLAFAEEYLEQLAEPDVVAAFLLFGAESPQFPEEARGIWRDGGERLHQHLAKWLSQAMQAGLLRHDDPHASAELLFGMLLGLDLERLRFAMPQRRAAARRAWAHQAVDAFLRAFGPETSTARC
jgi:AcrR family transcriptional regulator